MPKEITQGYTEFGAPVPTEEYEKFKAAFPQYGAVKWFINQSLIAFNERMEAEPSLKEHIDASIEQVVEMARTMRVLGGASSST